MARDLKFKINDTTLTSDVNQTLSNLLSQTNKTNTRVSIVEKTANTALIVAKGNTGGGGSGSSVPVAAYMLGPGILNLVDAQPNNASEPFAATANQVSVVAFYLAAQLNGLSHLDGSFGCGLGPGSFFAVGIYDANGNQLWTSGPLAVPNVSNSAISFSVPPLTLSPGNYYLAWTSADSGNTVSWGTDAYSKITFHSGTSDGNIVNQGTVLVGIAANSAASGPVMPSSLGTISLPTSGVSVPLVLFR